MNRSIVSVECVHGICSDCSYEDCACQCHALEQDASRQQAMEECAKAQCVWCGGTATYDANGADADQVDPVPIFLERQYVPNCGEMAGWSHKCNYGGYFSCDAHPIQALLETEKERAV